MHDTDTYVKHVEDSPPLTLVQATQSSLFYSFPNEGRFKEIFNKERIYIVIYETEGTI